MASVALRPEFRNRLNLLRNHNWRVACSNAPWTAAAAQVGD